MAKNLKITGALLEKIKKRREELNLSQRKLGNIAGFSGGYIAGLESGRVKNLKPMISADDEARVQYWIALSYADAGFTEQSIIEFLKVRFSCKPTKLPWGVTALYNAGQGYQKVGNLFKAREMFELVVKERGATDSFGRKAQEKIDEIDKALSKAS